MTRSYDDLAADLARVRSDDARRVYEAASAEFRAEVAARRAVGAAVARARKASGLTQVQLASAASVQQAEVSRIERGHANPTVSTLARIARATGSRLELVGMGERSV
jgi:XRE family transcriptional regulator, regulator of sulfur utilization